MPISWNTHPHNINKMTLIFFCFDNELIKKNVKKKGWLSCHPFKLFSKNTDFRINSFYQPLQCAAGTEFHKLGDPICYHLAHGLGP